MEVEVQREIWNVFGVEVEVQWEIWNVFGVEVEVQPDKDGFRRIEETED